MGLLAILKTAGGGTLHVVEAPFEFGARIEQLISTGLKDEPEIKAAVLQLVALGEQIGLDGAADVAASGLNVQNDIKTFTDIGALYSYVKNTFIPLVKKVYGEVKVDLATQAATTAVAAVTAVTGDTGSTEAEVGPGLHNTVAA